MNIKSLKSTIMKIIHINTKFSDPIHTHINRNFVMWPIQCFTCGEILARYQDDYEEKLMESYSNDDFKLMNILDELDIHRECCRTRILTTFIRSPVNVELDLCDSERAIVYSRHSQTEIVTNRDKDTKNKDVVRKLIKPENYVNIDGYIATTVLPERFKPTNNEILIGEIDTLVVEDNTYVPKAITNLSRPGEKIENTYDHKKRLNNLIGNIPRRISDK